MMPVVSEHGVRLEMCGLGYCRRGAAAKKCLGLPCGPAGIVVPPREISDALCAHCGR